MDAVKSALKPLTSNLPQGAQDFLEGGGWWLVLALVGLVLLLLLLFLAGLAYRLVFRRRQEPVVNPEEGLREDLSSYGPPQGKPGPRRITVEGFPARLRLVVVAPVGKDARVDAAGLGVELDQVIRGLGAVVQQDRPRIRVWPAQLSHQGFAMTFHRLITRPEPKDKPSRWLLVAGRTPGRRHLLLGLALYTDEPTTLGHINLEPQQWAEVVRIKTRDV